MPEMTFSVRWPDGAVATCYSPSLVMHDHLDVGAIYTLTDFLARTTEALDLASARVQAKYGFACTSAIQQKAELADTAGRFAPTDTVEVLAMQPPLPQASIVPDSVTAS